MKLRFAGCFDPISLVQPVGHAADGVDVKIGEGLVPQNRRVVGEQQLTGFQRLARTAKDEVWPFSLNISTTSWSRTRFEQFVTLRHRPDRIIVGEIRGGEAFDLLQLLNTGHSGTLSTVHANSAAQGISRFTTCVLQRGVGMPCRAIKTNIADSLNIIIQIER